MQKALSQATQQLADLRRVQEEADFRRAHLKEEADNRRAQQKEAEIMKDDTSGLLKVGLFR